MPFIEGVELKDSEEDLPITGAEVAEAVKQLLSGKAPGVYGIQSEFLKALDVVGMSWLTHIFSIAWMMGTIPLDWQAEVVIPIFKKHDQREFLRETDECDPPKVGTNFRGIISLPGKVYARVLEKRVRTLVESWRINADSVLIVEQWTSSSPLKG